MDSAIAEYGVAVAEDERPVSGRWNWGLMLALALCLAFWVAVILGVAVVV